MTPLVYIPQKDADLRYFAENFSQLISTDPVKYGLTPVEALTIKTAVDAYSAALFTTRAPDTRNVATIAAKDAARAVVRFQIRFFGQRIKGNNGVAPAAKAGLGLNQPDQTPTAQGAPQTQPLMEIVGATPLVHTLRFNDANTPNKRGKPKGALGIQVYFSIGSSPGSDPTLAGFYGMMNKQPFGVNHNPANVGKWATYFGRYMSRTGLVGPWSSPIAMIVV